MAPPPAAMKRGMGGAMVALIVIVVALIAFFAGAYVGAPLLGLTGPQKESVVVGTNTPFPPMEYRDPTTNALIGLDIDLMNEIGKRNNWNIVWQDFQDWDALLAAIEFQGVDVGASSITSNLPGDQGAAREAAFDFSDTYYEADQAVLIKAGSTAVDCAAAECTAAELANHTVAVQTLTSSYWWVLGNLVDTAMTPETMVSDFGDVNSVVQELTNDRVQWVLVDKPIAEKLVQGNSQLEIAGTIETDELYAFAVADGDPGADGDKATTGDRLLPKINSALAAMKADGTFDQIADKWLG